MRKLILITLLFISNVSLGQWVLKNVNNAFDDPYRICYSGSSNGVIMKLENVEGEITFYLSNGYFCDEVISTDISYLVNGAYKKYNVNAITSNDKTALFLVVNLLSYDMAKDFRNASKISIRVNETHCRSDVYEFNMTNSSKALDFIVQP